MDNGYHSNATAYRSYNLSISVNTPFTVLFNYQHAIVKNVSTVRFERLGKIYEAKGKWQEITIKMNYTNPVKGTATVTLKAFITNEKSVSTSQNIIGISPGPKSLKEYQFFYNFLDDGNGISQIEISVGYEDGYHKVVSNWHFESILLINERAHSETIPVHKNMHLDTMLSKNNIATTMTKYDFENSNDTILNFPILVQSLTSIQV